MHGRNKIMKQESEIIEQQMYQQPRKKNHQRSKNKNEKSENILQ